MSNLDGSVAIISTATNVITGRVQVGAPVNSLALTPDGGLLVAAGTNDKAALIDTTSNAVVSTVTTDPTADTASTPVLAVAANGTIYQTDNTDNVLRILNVVTTTIPNDPPVTDDPIVGTPDQQTGEVTGTIVASDPDGDDLSYTVTSAPVHGTVTVDDDGSFAYVRGCAIDCWPTTTPRTRSPSPSAMVTRPRRVRSRCRCSHRHRRRWYGGNGWDTLGVGGVRAARPL